MFPLDPKSIAVIGASPEEEKLGHYVLSHLIGQGYEGKIYPVNPKHLEILGVKTYASVKKIPSVPDMVVVVTPASTVQAIAEECGEQQVKALVVISAGFSETHTEEGKQMEAQLKETAARYDMALVGPNCLGYIRPVSNLNASFALALPPKGTIGLISQSGALAVGLMDAADSEHFGFSFVASIGNKAGLDECDFLELAEADKATTVIGMYLESIRDGARFLEVAGRVGKEKPIVFIKSGISVHGSKAVSSHTGALAGSETAIEAACEHAGIHHAQGMREFLSLLRVLSTEPPLLSRSIAIVTNAGGPGVLATDAAEREGLLLPPLSDAQKAKLQILLPPAASVLNPIDVLGDALTDRYQAAIAICAADPAIDGIVTLLTPQVMTPCTEIARAIIDVSKKAPLIPIVSCFMGGSSLTEAMATLADGGIVNFATPEEAVHALASLMPIEPTASDVDLSEEHDERAMGAVQILDGVNGPLSDAQIAELFALYDLPLPSQALARSADEAVALAKEIGFPVVLKVSSPDILHKTEVGGVRVNLSSEADVKNAYKEIMDNCQKRAPTAGLSGVLVQKFLPAGSEFIVGGLKDPVFGPLVMVGLGGIYTELFRDTVFRIAPVSEKTAYGMLEKLQSWKLLTGLRGHAPYNVDGMAHVISTVSELLADCPEMKELDLNPLLVRERDVAIADAKVIVGIERKFERARGGAKT